MLNTLVRHRRGLPRPNDRGCLALPWKGIYGREEKATQVGEDASCRRWCIWDIILHEAERCRFYPKCNASLPVETAISYITLYHKLWCIVSEKLPKVIATTDSGWGVGSKGKTVDVGPNLRALYALRVHASLVIARAAPGTPGPDSKPLTFVRDVAGQRNRPFHAHAIPSKVKLADSPSPPQQHAKQSLRG